MNKAVLIGRLTRDPDLRFTPNGIAVCKFTLAVDRPFTNNNGEREADFIPVVVWRKPAENAANYLRKGRMCAVSGRIQTRKYENNEGRTVSVVEVVADEVKFLERAENGQKPREDVPPPIDEPLDINDDDLPF